MRNISLLILVLWMGVLSALAAQTCSASPAQPLSLVPYPQSVQREAGVLSLSPALEISAQNEQDRFAAGTIVRELKQIEHVHARVTNNEATAGIVLAEDTSPTGRRLLQEAGISLPDAANAEGYALIVDAKHAAIVAHSHTGIFYGAQTLRQLLCPAQHGATLPRLRILDWPALRWRGSQVSLSQGAIPTMEDLKRAIRLLAASKQNLFMLYFENTFDYPSYPLNVLPDGGFTPSEARELVEYARPYHITLIPEQESIGHLHQILQEEAYRDVVEMPYGDVLSPAAPGSLPMITHMLQELTQAFPSPYIHIGADEPFELGQGRTLSLIQQKGKGEVYLEFVRQIATALAPSGRRVIFWGDIAQHYPELLDRLPHNMIAMAWNYHDLTDAQFEAMVTPFRKAGLETWVAPGVDNWNNPFPNYAIALPNILHLTEVGRRLGAVGMMNTTWNSDGETVFDACWYGLTYGAAVSWQNHIDDGQFAAAYDWAFYRAPGHHFEREIEQMAQIYRVLHAGVQPGLDTIIWQAPFTPDGQRVYLNMAPAASQVRLLAEDIIADLRQHRSLAQANRDLLAPLELGARRMDYLGQKALYTRYITELYSEAQREQAAHPSVAARDLDRIAANDGLLLDLRNRNSALMEEYHSVWLAGNHPYFLDNMLLHYRLEAMRLAKQIDRIRMLRKDLSQSSLPPLVQPLPGTVAKR